MSDDIQLNVGVGGPKVSAEDCGGTALVPRTKLVLGVAHTDGGDVTTANPLPAILSDGTNQIAISLANAAQAENAAKWLHTLAILSGLDPAAAAGSQAVQAQVESTAHPNLRVAVFNGANEMPTMDVVARKGFVSVTDGTNTMPTGDAVARSVFTKPNDGTNAFLSASAANVGAKTGINAMLTTFPGEWAVTNAPVANMQASASQAAGGAGVRHVCTSVSATVAAGGTAPTAATVTLNLRDGATGAGTVLQSWTLGIEATAGRTTTFSLSGLNIPGTAATAMTLEFAAAGGANTFESVSMTGYDVS